MSADVTPYTGLITSQHATRPKFMATVAASVQGYADQIAVVQSLDGLFDLDNAIGAQLDTVGQWIGQTRYIGGYTLVDTLYRQVLRAVALANGWDGTIPSAYAIWAVLFTGEDYAVLIFDNGDMTMDLGIIGSLPDALTLAIFEGGVLQLRPSGVRIGNYILPTAPDAPLFGFDIENTASIAGFDVGGWANIVPQP